MTPKQFALLIEKRASLKRISHMEAVLDYCQEKEIESAIKAADAKSMKDMGIVMSAVKLKVSGRANMAEVSQKIKEKLTNP